ncbi:MAG: hypothetical protein AAFX05_10785 [Planctomycetota bacterium]
MNDHTPTREDVVIGRIVDGEASPTDWRDLDALGESDPSVWRRLAEAQRVHARLEEAVEDSIAIAELIDLPAAPRRRNEVIAVIGRLSGWAVAAVLALSLLGPWRSAPPTSNTPNGTQAAGITLNSATPDQAWDQYINAGTQNGRIVERMPDMMLQAVEIPGSDMREVYIIRQVVERVRTHDMNMIKLHTTEGGVPVPVRSPVQTLGGRTPM